MVGCETGTSAEAGTNTWSLFYTTNYGQWYLTFLFFFFFSNYQPNQFLSVLNPAEREIGRAHV